MSAYVQVHPNESKKQCWEVYEEEMKPEKGRVCARERMRKSGEQGQSEMKKYFLENAF